MAIVEIPTSSIDSDFSQLTTLDGVEYELRFKWNQREEKWYLTILFNETIIASNIKLVADYPLLKYRKGDLLPPGILSVIDSTIQGIDPSLRDLGKRSLMIYSESSND